MFHFNCNPLYIQTLQAQAINKIRTALTFPTNSAHFVFWDAMLLDLDEQAGTTRNEATKRKDSSVYRVTPLIWFYGALSQALLE